MRFHVGFTFRPKQILKFLVPILIGLGAYFGFPNLFGYIQVNALEDYTHVYNITLDDIPYNSSFSGATFKDFYDDLIEMDSEYYNLIITYWYEYDSLTTSLWLVPKATTSIDFNVYGAGDGLFIEDSILYNRYVFDSSTTIDSSNRVYSAFLSCYTENTNCSSYPSYGSDFSQSNTIQFSQFYEDTSFDLGDYNLSLFNYFYYSGVDLVYVPDDTNDSAYVLKSLVINNQSVSIGDNLPTYAELNDLLPDEPIPPEPSDSTIADSIYWFTDNFTEYEVLVNIYVLLFLYCFSMIILKLLMIVKGVKW